MGSNKNDVANKKMVGQNEGKWENSQEVSLQETKEKY